MILDTLDNADLYRGLGERLAAGFEFLRKADLASLPEGRCEIRGDELYAMVQRGRTRTRDEGKWEAHRRYIDIQYILEGVEVMGYAPLDQLEVTQVYDSDKDYLLLAGKEGSFVTVRAGMFTVFFPDDAHMPGQAVNEPADVRKVVVKVLIG